MGRRWWLKYIVLVQNHCSIGLTLCGSRFSCLRIFLEARCWVWLLLSYLFLLVMPTLFYICFILILIFLSLLLNQGLGIISLGVSVFFSYFLREFIILYSRSMFLNTLFDRRTLFFYSLISICSNMFSGYAKLFSGVLISFIGFLVFSYRSSIISLSYFSVC